MTPFPAQEDLGIVTVEVMAAGRPVIAYGHGGATESVWPGVTGILFDRQDAESVAAALDAFDAQAAAFALDRLQRRAAEFSPNRFRDRFRAFAEQVVTNHRRRT